MPAGPRPTIPRSAWERYADRVELAYVDDAAHFIVDDAPAEMTTLALDWFDRAA